MKHQFIKELFENTDLSEKETALLNLMPLIQIAWAHGAISKREKHLIFAAAREDSIDERDLLNDTLDNLLTYQPNQNFFDRCFERIGEELRLMTVKDRAFLREKIIERCRAVAAAAGEKSPMDVNHHISLEEKELLRRFEEILRELTVHSRPPIRRLLETAIDESFLFCINLSLFFRGSR
jgi:hypothetical protein